MMVRMDECLASNFSYPGIVHSDVSTYVYKNVLVALRNILETRRATETIERNLEIGEGAEPCGLTLLMLERAQL